MPGISGAARLVKSAATSEATKTAVKKAAKSNVVKTAVSGIVVDAALPEIKERVSHLLKPDEETQDEEENKDFSPDDLGKWNEPTMLDLNSDLYARYLRNQILVLSEYETHLEQYNQPEFQEYVDSFYTQCEEPMLQLHAAELVAESIESYTEHIENYAVRNDEFRHYVLNGPEKPEMEDEVLSANRDTREALQRFEEYIELCNDYLDYLGDYTEEDANFASHVYSYGNFIEGDIQDLETAVLAALRYLEYLEEYTDKEKQFQKHIASFSPDSDAYYSLIETENQLLKEAQDNST